MENKSDHAIAALKSALATAPFCGELANIIENYIPIAKGKSIKIFQESLSEKLQGLEGRIDIETTEKDKLYELFQSCSFIILRTRQEKKIKAATSLLCNVLLKDGESEKLPFTELDHFSRCVENLSIGAIDTLEKAYSITSHNQSSPDNSSYPFIFRDLKKATNLDPNLLMGLVCELNAVNLLHDNDTTDMEEYDHKIFSLTPLGNKFVIHLLKK